MDTAAVAIVQYSQGGILREVEVVASGTGVEGPLAPVTRPIKFGISFRLFLAFAVISSLGILVSFVAAVSLRTVQDKFDHIATVQLQSFQAAENLIRQTEELARVAPNLYASRTDNSSLIQFSISSYELKSRLKALIDELETTTGGAAEVTNIRRSADSLFSHLDRLATSLYERSTNEYELRRSLETSAEALRTIGVWGPDNAHHLATVSSLLLDIAAVDAGPRLEALTSDVELALKEAEQVGVDVSPLRATLFGPTGLVNASKRRGQLLGQLSDLLAQSEATSDQLVSEVGALTRALSDDIRRQNIELAVDTRKMTALLQVAVVLTVLGAAVSGWYLRSSVIRRLQGLQRAIRTGAGPSELSLIAQGEDEIAEIGQSFEKFVREIAERDLILRQSRRRLENAIESVSEGFALFDAEDQLVVANTQYRSLMGFEGGQDGQQPLKFQTILESAAARGRFLGAKTAPDEWLGRQLSRHREAAPAFVQQLGDGGWVRVSERRTDEGGAVVIYADVTELKRVSEELREAKDAAERANEAKSAFLATMSHELRTPLNGIIGMNALLRHTSLDDEQQDLTETMSGAAEALLSIINDILDFSKIEAGAMEIEAAPLDLVQLVEAIPDILGPAASQKTLEVVCSLAADLPSWIEGDAVRLRQVLLNLANNAVKFTDRGEVELRVERPVDRNGMLLFKVRDTGIGIPPERMDRLFRSFSQVDASTTRKYGGTGLGLAISKRLVEMMGGEIGVESTIGEGSCFFFTLPEVAVEAPVPQEAVDLTGRSALILCRSASLGNALVERLDSWGAECTCLHDLDAGRAALADTAFDLVIADTDLAGFDVPESAVWLARDKGGQPVPLILLAGSRQGLSDLRSKAGGHAAAILPKPPKTAQLMRCLAEIFTGRVEISSGNVASAPTDTETFAGLKVLLVDDKRLNQKVAGKILEKIGIRPDICSSGAEAIEACQTNRYDVVFMDIEMPVMDGTEACRRIQELAPAWPAPLVVALTANAMATDRETYLEMGFDGYLSKPIDVDSLTDYLRGVCDRRSPGQSVARK